MKQEFNNDLRNRELSEDEKKKYLNCYNPEFSEGKGLFNDLPNKENIEARDIVLIYRWKLGRKKDADVAEIRKNIEEFRNAIISAKQDGSEIKAIKILQSIKGCGIAVASAILSVFCPNKFSVIDRRVLQELGYSGKKLETSGWDADSYWDEFIPMIREFAKSNNVDLRTADKILWGKSLSDEIDELLK